jgi:uncharacterized protein (DUF2126 family)
LGIDLAQFFSSSRSSGRQSLLPYRGFDGPPNGTVLFPAGQHTVLACKHTIFQGFTEEKI